MKFSTGLYSGAFSVNYTFLPANTYLT